MQVQSRRGCAPCHHARFPCSLHAGTSIPISAICKEAEGPGVLLVDNAALTDHVKKEAPSQRTRHFERATMLVKWAVMRLLVKLYLVKTEYMIADIFTKAVDKETFQRLRNNMMNVGGDENVAGMYARASRMMVKMSDTLGRFGGI